MNLTLSPNDITDVIEADRAHIWHHLTQHKPFETIDPRVIVEGRACGSGMPAARSILTPCPAGSGR